MRTKRGAACAFLLAAGITSLAVAGEPVKIAVQMDAASVLKGKAANMTLQLLDAANQPAAVTKPTKFAIQARLPSGKVLEMGTVEFATGEREKRWSQVMPATGLMYVWAKNPEMLPGGRFVNVRLEPGARAAPASVSRGPAGTVAPAPPPFQAPQVTLRYSPQRTFLADGKDAVSVEAFLMGDADTYPQDIRLNVYDSSHALKPSPLTIPAGQPFGEASLTSTSAGTVSVEFLGSSPSMAFQGDKDLKIQFAPPITRLEVQVSPPAITLVDGADIVATLLDETGHPMAPGVPRTISFVLTSGRGHLSTQQVAIPANQFQARASFVPEWPGPVIIQAHTDNLATTTAPVEVGMPLGLLLCSALGGAIGGFLTPRSRRKLDRYRIPVGIVTGFLLYWACIFLGLAAIGHQFVLNPLSALALSAIGGWLQTKVFSVVWGSAQAPQKP